MSRTTLFVLLGIFAVVLIFGYTAVIPTNNEPRAVPTNTPGAAAGGGDEAGEGGDSSGAAAAGQSIYDAQCAACHTTDGSDSIGPTWQGLIGSEIALADGSTVVADEEYITESIRQPAAKVHDGFQPIMPVFELNDDDIASLIAFMQSLE